MRAERPFVVPVRELPLRRTFTFSSAFVAESVKGLQMREALGAPADDPAAGAGVAEFDMYADGTHVFINGPFKGHVVVACSRCVGPAKLDIDEQLRVTFMPFSELPNDNPVEAEPEPPTHRGGKGGTGRVKPGAEPEPEPDVEVDEEALAAGDLDLFGYDGENLDLEPLFREQFVLAIPYAPLCRENCAGLCPQCGVDRNSVKCDCEEPIDPRLSALKSLKLPS
jgi:uncharacterized protein